MGQEPMGKNRMVPLYKVSSLPLWCWVSEGLEAPVPKRRTLVPGDTASHPCALALWARREVYLFPRFAITNYHMGRG